MNYTLKSQIMAIQEARAFLKELAPAIAKQNDLDQRLNDAGSTIAALNLSPNEQLKQQIRAAYDQYTFFMDGYRRGCASISEVSEAHDKFIALL